MLYSFCAQGGKSCTDGENPDAGLIMDAAGHLYGMTAGGGAHGDGTVFALTPNAAKTKWTETVLYSFCAHVVGELHRRLPTPRRPDHGQGGSPLRYDIGGRR